MCQKPIRTGKQLGDQSEKTAFLMQENGETGIRTPDTGLTPYNGLANRRLQPLGHLSGERWVILAGLLGLTSGYLARAARGARPTRPWHTESAISRDFSTTSKAARGRPSLT